MASYRFQNRDNIDQYASVPNGDYILGIEAAEVALTKKGDDKIEVQLRVVHPLPAGVEKGPLIYDHLLFSEKASWRIDTFLKSLGKQPKEKDVVVEIDNAFLQENVVARLCWATLTTEEYEGVKRNKVARYITNGKPDPYPMVNVKQPAVPAEDEELGF